MVSTWRNKSMGCPVAPQSRDAIQTIPGMPSMISASCRFWPSAVIARSAFSFQGLRHRPRLPRWPPTARFPMGGPLPVARTVFPGLRGRCPGRLSTASTTRTNVAYKSEWVIATAMPSRFRGKPLEIRPLTAANRADHESARSARPTYLDVLNMVEVCLDSIRRPARATPAEASSPRSSPDRDPFFPAAATIFLPACDVNRIGLADESQS